MFQHISSSFSKQWRITKELERSKLNQRWRDYFLHTLKDCKSLRIQCHLLQDFLFRHLIFCQAKQSDWNFLCSVSVAKWNYLDFASQGDLLLSKNDANKKTCWLANTKKKKKKVNSCFELENWQTIAVCHSVTDFFCHSEICWKLSMSYMNKKKIIVHINLINLNSFRRNSFFMLSLPQTDARKGTRLNPEHHWLFPDWVRNLHRNSISEHKWNMN